MARYIAPCYLHGIRTFHYRDFSIELLMAAKGNSSVSVILPAKNEAATIGEIVSTIHAHLMGSVGLVDELIVIDSSSIDATAEIATANGATVISCETILPEIGEVLGKGDALWRSVHIAKGDIILWADADIEDFTTRFITGPLGPLLLDPSVLLAKGFYHRPIMQQDGTLTSHGGGRVTELTARPLLALLHPDLLGIIQPLSGEYAIRREIAESIPFTVGYGVEIGMLIDLIRKYDENAFAQVDLEKRIHRNQPLHSLSRMSFEVQRAILVRQENAFPREAFYRPTVHPAGTREMERIAAHVGERPPLTDYLQGQ